MAKTTISKKGSKKTNGKTRTASSAKGSKSLSLRRYIRQQVDGHTLTSLARASKVSYSTLYRHVVQGFDLRPATARKLERWSKGKISVAKIMAEKPRLQRR